MTRLFSANQLPVRRLLDRRAGDDLERQAELREQLVLPLLDQAARADDQAAAQIAADEQLLDEQPGHDRLAGAGVVGQQEPQRLARQHLAVDGGDLVRQRLDERGVDGQQRVEQVGQADAVGLGDEPEAVPRRRRSSRAARSVDDLEASARRSR